MYAERLREKLRDEEKASRQSLTSTTQLLRATRYGTFSSHERPQAQANRRGGSGRGRRKDSNLQTASPRHLVEGDLTEAEALDGRLDQLVAPLEER